MTTPESYSDMRVDSWPPPPRIAMAIHTAIQVHAYGLFTPPAQIRAAPAIYGAPLPMCLRCCTISGLGGGGGVRDENVSQVWRQTFGRHFPDTGRNVSQKLPDLPTRAQTKKYYGSRMCHECVKNVSRMCHKKVWPKSTFWEVPSLRLEPVDLVNEHVLPKVKR